jgi:hypothetical protein
MFKRACSTRRHPPMTHKRSRVCRTRGIQAGPTEFRLTQFSQRLSSFSKSG